MIRNRTDGRNGQAGLTLIEVMIALVIGMVVLIALGTMLVGALKHFKVSDDFSRMQENGAYALNAIGQDVRMAGFYGQTGLTSFVGSDGTAVATNPAATNCGLAWIESVERPIAGFDGMTAAAANAVMSCIATTNFQAGSPLLILRGALGRGITPAAAANISGDVLYIQSNAGGGVLFNGQDLIDAWASRLLPPWRVMPDSVTMEPVYPYQLHAYYLRPCSRPAGANCAATDDNGSPIPTLVRQEVTQGVSPVAMTEQPVAEGVERISFLYGEDLDGDGFPNFYRTAANVAVWGNVVTVRVAVLVRSVNLTKGYDDSGKSYDMGDGTAAFVCAGTACQYHRHLFSQTFQARNVSQRMQS